MGDLYNETQRDRDRAAIELLKHKIKVGYATGKVSLTLLELNDIIVVAENVVVDPSMREVEVI